MAIFTVLYRFLKNLVPKLNYSRNPSPKNYKTEILKSLKSHRQSILIHICWLLVLKPSQVISRGPVWAPTRSCKHRRIRGHRFYDSPGSHSTWCETSNNKNQVWELLSHAERAPLDLDVFPVFLPVSLECGTYRLRETELTLKRLHFWRTLNAPNKILQGKTKYTLTMKEQPGHFLQDTHRHRPSCWQQVTEKSWPQCPNGETEGKATP